LGIEGRLLDELPSISNEQITWQYTRVSINYPFNNGIYFEILDTLYLPEETLQGEEIEDEAFSIVGLNNSKGISAKTRYNPHGFIRVENTETNFFEGVKNVKIYARNWFKIATTFTNESGEFYINKRFVSAKVTVSFQNSHVNIKTIPGVRLWRVAYCSRIFLNSYNKIQGADLTNISLNLGINSDLSSRGSRDWSAATINNAIEDMQNLCTSENIPCAFNHLNVYAINWNDMGAAPMFRKMANSSLLDDFINITFGFVSTPLLVALEQYLPDVLIGYGDNNNSRTLAINQTVFHEFGHVLHYNQLQSNSWWMNLISYETISHPGDYGDLNSNNSGYAAIAESWSFFLEEYFAYRKFSPTDSRFLDNLNLNGFTFNWIPEGLPLDLLDTPDMWGGTDTENPIISDNVLGISVSQYFSNLTSNMTEMNQIRDALMINFPTQSTEIQSLYNSYGF